MDGAMVREEKTVKISVRNLVEFILRSGDINTSMGGMRDTDAMQEGSRIHRKIQKRMGPEYQAEVPLRILVPVSNQELEFSICVEGRADGIIHHISAQEKEQPTYVVDEIKGIYQDIAYLEAPILVHRAQVMCYAYIWAKEKELSCVGIRLTYCNLETEAIRYFEETLSFFTLEEWFFDIIEEYAKWASWQISWGERRNQSIKQIEFPFSYRPGQRDLVTGVYKTIIRDKKLYIEAPTGVGKTISTIFPAVKAMGEGHATKLFYLTAKTITRTVAEETMQLLIQKGLQIKTVTITAKDKICILPKAECNPIVCERAKGHYDRVNAAVFDLLTTENEINRENIGLYAEKHRVCPFEMSLDVTLWADSIICDYNYVFDPNVYLKRFFMNEKKNDYVFLVDEAHNLVERAREMYSAALYKEDFLQIKKIVLPYSKKLSARLQTCNGDLVKLKRACDEFEVVSDIQDFSLHLLRLLGDYETFLQEFTSLEQREEVLEFYMQLRHFMAIFEWMDEKYKIYTDYTREGVFRIKLQCMDPSTNLSKCLEKGKSAVFFSATLLPIQYYKEQLAGTSEDYAIYAPSPFSSERRKLMIGTEVSTKYTRRNHKEYVKIVEYILAFTEEKVGNYMVFFPSYQMLEQIYAILLEEEWGVDFSKREVVIQKSNMSEQEKEVFLNDFLKGTEQTRIGFCVLGGIFGEGIDLKEDRLIGAVIVGTGLPLVCNERELFRTFYEERKGAGFAYAYLYQGMNKVLQAAGRVIRTDQDKGAILLLDERFSQKQYQALFPREWFPYECVTRKNIKETLQEFWEEA